jgi:actin-related protein
LKKIIEEIKISMFEISENSFNDKMEVSKVSYELPDGKTIDFNSERFLIPELFFMPNTNSSIPRLINESLNKCDTEVKKEISQNTILSGSNTLLKGFNKRIEREISNINLAKLKSPTIVPQFPFSPHTNWIGGSILASLGSFQQMWISKSEFEENNDIIHKKCS